MNYDIANLLNIFLRHHDEKMKHDAELQEKYPDSEFLKTPNHAFSLPLALHSICAEILKIREKNNAGN